MSRPGIPGLQAGEDVNGAEPGSASQDALNLLASWVAALEPTGSSSDQPGKAR